MDATWHVIAGQLVKAWRVLDGGWSSTARHCQPPGSNFTPNDEPMLRFR